MAVKNVSFDVQEGEFLVIIGLSGSGKTTLLRCINRLLAPTSGSILLKGQSVDQVRREIGMIFQQFNLVPRLSVLENVLTGQLALTPTWRSLLHLHTAQEKEQAKYYLRLVGLEEKTLTRADQLSGGQQQRVAIARALYQNPELILADEPVASLDPALSRNVMNYLKTANEDLKKTIVCNLHFLSLVREYAHRVIALKAGEIVFEGRPDQINKEWFQKIYGEQAQDIHVD